jgi:hypothetical protein
MIKWKPKQDNVTEGLEPRGKVYLMHDREGKVRAIYTCFGETQKHPLDPSLPLTEAQLLATHLTSPDFGPRN